MGTVVENISSLKAVKADIKAAIEDKGVDMTNVPFTGYAQKIGEITTDSGDYETGFENGVAAQKAKLTNITITNNGTYTNEDGYSTVVVDVAGGTTGSLALLDGTKFTNSTFTTIPNYYDFSEITDMSYMFKGCELLVTLPQLNTTNVTNMYSVFEACKSLQTIPLINTSNVVDMRFMFANCKSLQTIPQLDTSNVTNMVSMFIYCDKLQTIPQIDTSNVSYMGNMFRGCTSLQTIPQLDTSNVSDMSFMFNGCGNLTSLPMIDAQNVNYINFLFGFNEIPYLTDVGGWSNLECNWSDDNGLAKCPNLTYQSCINVLNGLADVTELGSRTLKVHSNFLTTVGDEISIGINKGWTISA